ncbi:hypothetical protein [Dyella koreensis]|uniref:Uncharacterized protein n=1 Tax=Dyella koreensis TaxID=311235 RepID=A0ABW8K9T5_9GAMM
MTSVTLHTFPRISVYYGFTAAQGQPGVETMHMPLADSALGRGMQRVAGMLIAKTGLDAKPAKNTETHFQLVSWRAGARSRREDELARCREQQHELASIES